MRRHQHGQDHRIACDQLQAGELLRQRGRALQRRDALELGCERLHAQGFEARDVHARRVEVTDLLRRRASLRRAARARCLLQEVAQLAGDRFLHHEIAGDLQLVAGNLRGVEPAAARVAPEVLPRVRRGVHLRRREAEREPKVPGSVGGRWRRRVRRLGGGRARRQQQRGGHRKCCAEDPAVRGGTAHG
jgi:hypothetical protein